LGFPIAFKTLSHSCVASICLLLVACGERSVPIPPLSAQPSYVIPSVLTAQVRHALPRDLAESSGLAAYQGRFWTHNDSGHSAHLYEISAQGEVLRQVHPLKSVNIDWEDLAQDEQHLYIADCGNNLGDREWLQIYRVAWADLERTRHQGVVPSTQLDLRMADRQTEVRRHRHDQDCEALAVVGDELWLFSKNWSNQHTRLYRFNKTQMTQSRSAEAEYPVQGLITAADYDAESGLLALLGYQIYGLSVESFVWLLPLKLGQLPDWQQARRFKIDPPGQWEAILWQEDALIITRERSLLGRAEIARLPIPFKQHLIKAD
jgi:hypothetical protein